MDDPFKDAKSVDDVEQIVKKLMGQLRQEYDTRIFELGVKAGEPASKALVFPQGEGKHPQIQLDDVLWRYEDGYWYRADDGQSASAGSYTELQRIERAWRWANEQKED